MKNSKVKEIINLNEKIENMVSKTTSYYSVGGKQILNNYDNEILKDYQKILDLIIEISMEEKTKDIEVINKKYFAVESTASMMIESYISILQFYRNIDKEISKKEIQAILKIQKNLILNKELEINNEIELADCYFHIGNENKAKQVILDFIKHNPYEDEAYMCMQNWYMYEKQDINKLAEVVDLADENNHILITDFAYDELVEFYDSIGDENNKKKYQKLYEKWKNSKEID